MSEMRFIKSHYTEDIDKNVNEALEEGFDYVETHFQGGGASSYTYILVVLRKN